MIYKDIKLSELDQVLSNYKWIPLKGDCSELWAGLDGSETIKSLVSFGGDDNYFCDYEINVDDLKKDPLFYKAIFSDEDINHHINLDGSLDPKFLNSLFDWYNGITIYLPITHCGLGNFMHCYKGAK